MKQLILALTVATCLFCIPCSGNTKSEVSDVPKIVKPYPEDKLKSLIATCQLWGFLKYHHPYVAEGNYDWDKELISRIPEIVESDNEGDWKKILDDWISSLPLVKESKEKKLPNKRTSSKPDYGELFNPEYFNTETIKKIKYILDHAVISTSHYVSVNSASGQLSMTNESPYSDLLFPSLPYRLLALFRYWNSVNYYFPYRDLCDQKWSAVLVEMLPAFIACENEEEYISACLKLVTKIDDSHASLHGFVISFVGEFQLFLKPFELIDRVIQLGVGIGQFLAIHHQFEAFRQFWIFPVTFAQRGHFVGIVGDKGWLNVIALAGCTENFIDQLAFAHGRVFLHVELVADFTELVFVHALDVDAGIFLDGIDHRNATERGLEADGLAVYLQFGCAVDFHGDALKHLFSEVHHPVVILIGYVYFHGGEFRIVGPVHAFVTEIFGKFVNAFESPYDQAFQIQFISDAEVQRNVQGIVVCDERTGGGTSRNGLENGRFHFHVTAFVEEIAHGRKYLCPFAEDVLYLSVYHEVDVPLTVPEFWVGKRIKHSAVFFFNDRQRTQGFCQHGQAFGVDGNFTHLSPEHIAFDTDKVSDVE